MWARSLAHRWRRALGSILCTTTEAQERASFASRDGHCLLGFESQASELGQTESSAPGSQALFASQSKVVLETAPSFTTVPSSGSALEMTRGLIEQRKAKLFPTSTSSSGIPHSAHVFVSSISVETLMTSHTKLSDNGGDPRWVQILDFIRKVQSVASTRFGCIRFFLHIIKSNFPSWFLQDGRRPPNPSSRTVRKWEALWDWLDHCRHPWESIRHFRIQSSISRSTLELPGSRICGVHLRICKSLLAKRWCSPPHPQQWSKAHCGHFRSGWDLRLCDAQGLVGHQWPRVGFSYGPRLQGIYTVIIPYLCLVITFNFIYSHMFRLTAVYSVLDSHSYS